MLGTLDISRLLALDSTRAEVTELLDLPDHDPSLLAENLRDMRRVNRWLGGIRLTTGGLRHLSAGVAPGERLRILDVGTGGADIPHALAAWTRRRGIQADVVAIDLSVEILGIAEPAGTDSISFAVADGCHLPFADDSFDLATCSLVLHHLAPDRAIAMFRELERVAWRGVVVNDLVRNWHGLVGAWLLSHVFTRNRLTRHDAPLSVRRAYTIAEMEALASAARMRVVRVDGFLGYRVALTLGRTV